MFHLTKWDLDRVQSDPPQRAALSGLRQTSEPWKTWKNSVFCDTQGKPGKLREFEIDF